MPINVFWNHIKELREQAIVKTIQILVYRVTLLVADLGWVDLNSYVPLLISAWAGGGLAELAR